VSVTTPAGFRAAGVTAGLKASGRPDLALVVNDGPLQVAAGVFTTNRVVAAPVVWSRQAVSDGVATAVVLNSGGANACTGPEGFGDTHRTAEHVAQVLGTSAGDVLVCSTGCRWTCCSRAWTAPPRRSPPRAAPTPPPRS
jgi:glutamate N-acetyltransferase/amino-acid N-acetyltransferase